jgi:hypothetical protein
MHGSPPIPRFDWAALAPVTGSVKADNLTLDLTGTFKNIGPLVVSNALTINAAKGIDNSNASIHTGTLNINSHDGWLNNTNGQINAQSFKADIAGQLNNNQGKISVVGNAHLKTGDVVASNGSFKSTNGNFTLDSTGNIIMTSSHLDASGDLTVKAQGKIIIDGAQTYTRTESDAGVRQSLQTERSSLTAQGNVTVFGKQSVQMDATDVTATTGKASVRSEGNVTLGFNTDTEQHNWTTSSTRRSGLKKKTTTTQHETQDKTAEVTRITGNQVEVRGQNVTSFGAEFNGTELVHVEGVDQTLLYDVKEEKTTQANSRTTSSFAGFSYKKSTSTDTTMERQALGTELISDKAVRVGVGTVTDLRGAVLDAPKVDFVRSEGADTSQPGQLILGASVNTSQTSHTETTTTAGVWQKQAGHGSTTQTANQTQIHGELSIDESIQTTVQVPDVVSTSGKQPNASAAVGTVAKGTAEAGSTAQPAATPVAQSSVQSQLDTLSQQPGLSYLSQLQNNPNVNWSQIQLAKDQWSYSQQGLTPAGAALLAIAIAVYTGGMGAELFGTTTSAAGAAGAAGASTTALAGTTLATTTAATATAASVTTYTAAGAALNAGFGALVSTAGISFVNNGGDIGQTLKDMGSKDNVKNLLIAMGTGGVGASVAGQGFTAVAAQTLTGCVAGEVSGAGCETGAKTAAVLSGAGEAYRAWVGYAANAGPGENRNGTKLDGASTGNASYEPVRAGPNFGQQQPVDRGMNVIGFNQPGSWGSQGGTLSRALNQVPTVNATAGLHDYIFNAQWLEQTTFNNIWTMPASALVAIPAALNNPNILWVTQIKQPESTRTPVVQSIIRINSNSLITDALVGELE